MKKLVTPCCGVEPQKFMETYNCPNCFRPFMEGELIERDVSW